MTERNDGHEISGQAAFQRLSGSSASSLPGLQPRSIHDADADLVATVILPAYNEEAALEQVFASLFAVIDASTEVIVVDDGSTDATATIASRYPCRLLRHRMNYGKGAAVQSGLQQARGRFVVVMDADCTYPSEVIPSMIAMSDEYDFVRCVRSEGMSNSPLVNRVGSKVLDSILRAVYRLEGFDHLSGLYGIRQESFKAMRLSATEFDVEIEIAIKARAQRLRSVCLPIVYHARIGEKKLQSWRDGWVLLRQIVSMALTYNPGLTFVLPGVLIWGLAAVLLVILSQGSLRTPYVGRLDVNSFIVAAMGATVGFQFVVFGVAAAVFGVEHGSRPGQWLVILSHGFVRLGVAMAGILSAVFGIVMLSATIVPWLSAGGGEFFATRRLVLAGLLVSLGVQGVLAALFISIFAHRLRMAARADPEGRLLTQVEPEPHETWFHAHASTSASLDDLHSG